MALARWEKYWDLVDPNASNFVDLNSDHLQKVFENLFKDQNPGRDKVVAGVHDSIIRGIMSNSTIVDGRVKKEDFFSVVKKNIGQPLEKFPSFVAENTKRTFALTDPNKTGELKLPVVIKYVQNIKPSETVENIEKAYNWALAHSPTGKYDEACHVRVIHTYVASPGEEPYAEVLLPFLRRHD